MPQPSLIEEEFPKEMDRKRKGLIQQRIQKAKD